MADEDSSIYSLNEASSSNHDASVSFDAPSPKSAAAAAAPSPAPTPKSATTAETRASERPRSASRSRPQSASRGRPGSATNKAVTIPSTTNLEQRSVEFEEEDDYEDGYREDSYAGNDGGMFKRRDNTEEETDDRRDDRGNDGGMFRRKHQAWGEEEEHTRRGEEKYFDIGNRDRGRGRVSQRERERGEKREARSRSQSPPEYFYDEEGKGWVSYRERPLTARSPGSASHRALHSKPPKRYPRRPASAGQGARKPIRSQHRRGTRRSAHSKRLNELAKPKIIVQKEVSTLLEDCENCTFTPQVTRYAAEMEVGDFMNRVPKYTKKYMEKKNQVHDVQFAFEPQLNIQKGSSKKKGPSKEGKQKQFLKSVQADIDKRNRKYENAYKSFDPPKPDPKQRAQKQKKLKEFYSRLESDIKRRDKYRQPHDPAKRFSFKPETTKSTKHEPATMGGFYERMESDIQSRKMKIAMQLHMQDQLHKPKSGPVSSIKKKMDKKVQRESFLLRYADDLQKRKEGIEGLRKAKEDIDLQYSYQPEISKLAQKSAKGSFLSRYEADLEERTENFAAIQKKYKKKGYLT